MTQPYVKQTIENDVGYIEFFHPSHNSLPRNILEKLALTITEAGKNKAIKVIVLKSGGIKTFCAGASFNELININDSKTGKIFFSGFANVINAMRKCPKFIIGSVQGKAVGGGVGLASATDYCMATKSASIKLSELNVGIGPFVVGPAVERKIGLSAMSQIAIDANNFYSSSWAIQKGLYTQVYENIEELNREVKKFAETLSKYNAKSMSEIKKMFWANTDHWDTLLIQRAKISGKLVLMDYTKKLLQKYK